MHCFGHPTAAGFVLYTFLFRVKKAKTVINQVSWRAVKFFLFWPTHLLEIVCQKMCDKDSFKTKTIKSVYLIVKL